MATQTITPREVWPESAMITNGFLDSTITHTATQILECYGGIRTRHAHALALPAQLAQNVNNGYCAHARYKEHEHKHPPEPARDLGRPHMEARRRGWRWLAWRTNDQGRQGRVGGWDLWW